MSVARTRVLFITRKWPPAVGGMEAYCRELIPELRKRAEVELRALPGRTDGRPPSLMALARFGFATVVELLLRGTHADVVHVGDLALWPMAWLAGLRAPKIRKILSAHGTDIALAHRRGTAAAIYRGYIRLATLALPKAIVLANSRATASLCEASGFHSVRVVALASSIRKSTPAKRESYVVFVGRLMRRKGCAWFIEHVLPRLDPTLTLMVAGVVWDPEEKRALDNSRVVFRGLVFGDELAELRANATAVIVPNLAMGADGFEGFGLTAVEAAADGGVVLAANVDGFPDSVRDGETGFLLPPGDAERWAAKINEVSGWTNIQRRDFLNRARACVAKAYSWSRVVEETVAAYEVAPGQASQTLEGPAPVAQSVAVVVPVYGQGPYLEAVISALQKQSPSVASIVISHSGEGDPSSRFAGIDGVTVLHSPQRLYAGAARNRGLALAQTEWVAFIDEDIIVGEGWHRALLSAIAGGESDCIVGSIGCASSGGYWGMSVWYIEFGSVHPYLSPRPIFAGASANLAIQRKLLDSIGGFPEDWPRGQDTVAQVRLRKAGARIMFEPTVIGRHFNVPGLKRMLRHLYVTGRHSAKVRRAHPWVPGGAAARIPVLSFGLWLARLVQTYSRPIGSRNPPLVSLVLHTPGILLGLFAWNAGFIREAFRRR